MTSSHPGSPRPLCPLGCRPVGMAHVLTWVQGVVDQVPVVHVGLVLSHRPPARGHRSGPGAFLLQRGSQTLGGGARQPCRQGGF